MYSRLLLPPRVTPAQWAVGVGSVALAASALWTTTYEQMSTVALLLIAANTVLMLLVAYEGLERRVLGKFFLVGASYVFFWIGLLSSVLQQPSFQVPPGLQIGTRRWSLDLVHGSVLAITLFQVTLLAGYDLRPRFQRLVSWFRRRQDHHTPSTKVLPYIFGGLGLFTLLLAYQFNLQMSTEALLASRSGGVQGRDIGLLGYLNFFGLYGAALVFNEIFLSERETSLPKSMRILGAIIMAAPFIAGGTRHLALFALLPAVVLLLKRWQGRITPARALRWLAVGLLVLVVMEFQFVVRRWGWANIGEASHNSLQLDQFGQFDSLLYAEFLVPLHHPYFLEPAEPFFVIHWIPRQFWPDKPIMESWSYYNRSFVGRQLFNVTPSIIGQYHMNWGTWGVLFAGLWLGLLGAITDVVFLNLHPGQGKAVGVTLGMFYAFLISSFRFYSPVYFYYFVFGAIGMLTMTRTLRPAEMLPGRWGAPVGMPRPAWPAKAMGVSRPLKP